MADKKIRALTESTALSTDELFHVVDSPSSSPSNKKITTTNVFNKIPTFLGLNSTETITSSGACSVTTAVTLINNASGGAATGTLADVSTVGQVKTVIAQAIAGGTTKLTATTTMGAAAAWTFLAIGTSVTLMWTGSVGWCAIGQGSMINGTGSASGVNIGITTASS